MALTQKLRIIIGSVVTIVVIGLVVGITVGVVVGRRKPATITVEKRALQILENNPLIDGHNDWAWAFRSRFQNSINNLDLNNMTQYKFERNILIHTDITRLRQGQVGGQFWSIYTRCDHQGKDATISFLEQIDLMNRIIAKHPDVFQMAKTAQEVRQAFSAKRIASLFGVEGGQAIESSFGILRIFYQLGVRYMTLTHNCNTPWADQNQVDRVNSTLIKNNGLTAFGKKVIEEMNRLGMLVDLAHVSKQTMLDVLNISRSPIIFSHSSAYSLCNHTRNVQDDVLELVKKNQGLVMVTFAPGFITCNSSNDGSIADVAAHINHIRKIADIDSVGIGGDYDGVDVLPTGLEDVSKYPKLIEYLIDQGDWTDDDIIKLVGGNILRVLEKNEQIAQELQKTMKPHESLIERNELEVYNLTQCRYLDMYTTTV
ncbi:unnamed protein product [Rotaria socialis]|uniref:Dipeptidase n=1 Tax=Rotaria socialis TaxID=392032 RepID=A0A820BC33_9BILA|nr:unnamed protein product [Rotaria socialis]CAF3379752.1 unnamed protein product [Rotaria socialis]CAF3390674.1 unnamed protein product [Rotaria socialis]CAF3451131.1 unnamed protein product [Rotaria socialis]CAF4107540.1 unnamed protein product [Rotaria socialis]